MTHDGNEWRQGWRALAGASIGNSLGYGLFLMTAGLFIIPMQEEFGWSRSGVSIGPMVTLLAACLSPFAGVLIDRIGARPLAIMGLAALGASYILLALAPASHLYLYSVAIFMSVVATVSSGVIYCAGVVSWFRRNSGLAIGITLSGLSVVAAAAMPALAWLIEVTDWRRGYLALSGLTVLVGLPFVFLWFGQKHKPVRRAASGDAAALPPAGAEIAFAQAIRDRRFWLCIACFGGAALPIGGFMSQLQPLLRGNGFAPEVAAALGSVFALSIAVGRLLGGVLLDRLHPPTVAAVLLSLPALGALLLVSGPLETVWIAVALAVFFLGLGQGAEVDFLAFFTARIFGMLSYATISATIGASVGVGMALGGGAFALVHDVTGSYDPAIYLSAGIYLCAALLALLIHVPPAPDRKALS